MSADLLDQYRLEAEVYPEYTIHSLHTRSLRGQRERVRTRWDRGLKIGEGTFGQVWRETSSPSDGSQQVRAVKMIDKQRMRAAQVDIDKELLALAKFSKGQYRQVGVLVSFLGWFDTEQTVFLAMEYLEKGDLGRYISEVSTEDEVRQIIIDLLEGLQIIHSEGFAHRDLKPQNIFVVEKPPESHRWWVKIGDFGISKRVKFGETALRTQTGTLYFQAPEVLGFLVDDEETFGYSKAVDIWSLGCVMYNLAAKRIPFARMYDINAYCLGRRQLYEEPLSPILSDSGVRFLKSLLAPVPTKRVSVKDALDAPWVLDTTSSEGPQQEGSSHRPRAAGQSSTSDDMTAKSDYDRGHDRSPAVSGQSGRRASSTKSTQSPHPITTQEGEQETLPIDVAQEEGDLEDKDEMGSYARRDVEKQAQPQVWSLATDTTSILPEAVKEQRLAEAPASTSPPDRLASLLRVISKREQVHSTHTSTNSPTSRGDTLPLAQADPSAHQLPLTGGPTYTLGTERLLTWNSVGVLAQHSGQLSCVAFSPNGELVASGSFDGTVKLTAPSEKDLPCLTLSCSETAVIAVAFSPDNWSIAIGCADHTLRLWTLGTEDPYHQKIRDHSSPVSHLSFSPDGKLILSSSKNQASLVLWHRENLTVDCELVGHTGPIRSASFSPTGRSIVSASMDKTVRVWQTSTGWNTWTFRGHTDGVMDCKFSPDGSSIVSGSMDGTVTVWNTRTGAGRDFLPVHKASVNSVDFSPDSSFILSGSDDRTVKLSSAAGDGSYKKYKDHTSSVSQVAFSPDGRFFVSVSPRSPAESSLVMRDLRDRDGTGQFINLPQSGRVIEFSPDGRALAVGSKDGALRLVRAEDIMV